MNIAAQPLHKLHQLRLAGEITTMDIVESCIQNIQQADGELKCFLSTYFDQARQSAEVADNKIKSGKKIDYLTAMPIAIKDIFNMQGTKTTCGSNILKDYISPYDATVVKKLKAAGATVIGKTNMDEFAMGSSTEHSAFSITKNPNNRDYVPGGSSGGSAAALAAKMCVGAIGTDTGGSIRQPAGFCGVLGIKPTYGTVSRYGMVAFGSSLDQAGPIVRDVKDAAIILDRITGYDRYDSTSRKKPLPNLLSTLNEGVDGMKLGVIGNLDLGGCSNEIQQNFQTNLKLLEDAGVKIVNINIANIEHAISTYYIIATAEASSNLGRYDGVRYGLRSEQEKLLDLYCETRNEGFGEEVKLRILLGTFVLSAGYYDAYYGKAKKVQALLRKQFEEAFETVDAVALPIAPTTAFKIGDKSQDPMQMYLTDVFTVPANLTGIPGISVPAGIGENNLPIGFQMVAAHMQEAKLLRLALALEKHHGLQST